MAIQYIDTYVGAKDGTKSPPDRLDGRKVGAKRSSIWGSKPAGVQWNFGDLIFIADLAAGESVREILVTSDTSLGTSTLAFGTIGNPTKYAPAKTMTAVDTPTIMGPKATQAAAAPLTADEDMYVTLGVAAIPAAVNLTFEVVIASIK